MLSRRRHAMLLTHHIFQIVHTPHLLLSSRLRILPDTGAAASTGPTASNYINTVASLIKVLRGTAAR